jgi:hypothetical protein
MLWRPSPPDKIVKVLRDGEEAWVGVVKEVAQAGDKINVRCVSPDALLEGMPLPFTPPAISLALARDGFRHWWRKLLYVFELSDPATFPPLEEPWHKDELRALSRFVSVTQSLARSAVVGTTASVSCGPSSDGQSEELVVDLPPVDLQAGFSTLLRQCHSSGHDPARYDRVRSILGRASAGATDGRGPERMATLKRWHLAVKSLRRKSLEQLLHETFVDREGWLGFERTEMQTPDELLETFNYGDLIHWTLERDELVSRGDPYTEALQRFAFLSAAVGLAHIYIGFGALVRSAVTDGILVP